MMPHRSTSNSRSFTLVEIIIVASLITVLSSIAAINWRTWVTSNKRKTTIGDLRTLAYTMSNAHMDLQMFPKFCYLYLNRALFLPYGADSLPPDFEAMGHDQAPSTFLDLKRRSILSKWKGPYYNSPASRSTITPGLGYVTKMRMPSASNEEFDWPADPWGNPYVVYLVHITSGGELFWIRNPYEKPNYKAIVVSYGPNGVPGGSTNPLAADRLAALEYRLYNEPTPRANVFVALTYDELRTNSPVNRREALSNQFGYLGPGFPGILDPGSDDLVFDIP